MLFLRLALPDRLRQGSLVEALSIFLAQDWNDGMTEYWNL